MSATAEANKAVAAVEAAYARAVAEVQSDWVLPEYLGGPGKRHTENALAQLRARIDSWKTKERAQAERGEVSWSWWADQGLIAINSADHYAKVSSDTTWAAALKYVTKETARDVATGAKELGKAAGSGALEGLGISGTLAAALGALVLLLVVLKVRR